MHSGFVVYTQQKSWVPSEFEKFRYTVLAEHVSNLVPVSINNTIISNEYVSLVSQKRDTHNGILKVLTATRFHMIFKVLNLCIYLKLRMRRYTTKMLLDNCYLPCTSRTVYRWIIRRAKNTQCKVKVVSIAFVYKQVQNKNKLRLIFNIKID